MILIFLFKSEIQYQSELIRTPYLYIGKGKNIFCSKSALISGVGVNPLLKSLISPLQGLAVVKGFHIGSLVATKHPK